MRETGRVCPAQCEVRGHLIMRKLCVCVHEEEGGGWWGDWDCVCANVCICA